MRARPPSQWFASARPSRAATTEARGKTTDRSGCAPACPLVRVHPTTRRKTMDQVVDRATEAPEDAAIAEGSAQPLPGIPLSGPQLREIGFHVCQDILEALQKQKDIDAAENAAALGAHLSGEPLDWNATWMRGFGCSAKSRSGNRGSTRSCSACTTNSMQFRMRKARMPLSSLLRHERWRSC